MWLRGRRFRFPLLRLRWLLALADFREESSE
jgi:hypothetical protein